MHTFMFKRSAISVAYQC